MIFTQILLSSIKGVFPSLLYWLVLPLFPLSSAMALKSEVQSPGSPNGRSICRV